MPIDFGQIVFVQPRFRRAVEVVAIIEHETGLVRMPEIFEPGDLHLIARLAVVQIINDILAAAKQTRLRLNLSRMESM